MEREIKKIFGNFKLSTKTRIYTLLQSAYVTGRVIAFRHLCVQRYIEETRTNYHHYLLQYLTMSVR